MVTALLALAALGALAEAAGPAAPLTVFTVNTPIDAPDDTIGNNLCHNATNGLCSLRAALQELNAGSGGTINLPAGTYTLTLDGLGDLQISKDISLLGAGPATTLIQGNPAGWTHRILKVQYGAIAIVSGVTISGGNLLLQNGGGIDVITSTLLLTNSVVTSNTAASGGGIYNSGQLVVENSVIRSNQAITSGGGIYSNANDPAGTGATLTLRQSQVLSNSVQRQQGGGLYYNDLTPALGYVLLAGSTVSGNVALGVLGQGGGLYQIYGSLVISNSVIDANQSTQAAGLYDTFGRLEVVDSTIEGNLTTGNGGGLEVNEGVLVLRGVTARHNQAAQGGGVRSYGSWLEVTNSGLISNTATTGGGGGWYSVQDTGTFTIAVFSQNLAATTGGYGGGLVSSDSALTFTASVFAGNVAENGGGLYSGDSGLPAQTMLISSTVSGNHANTYGGGLYTNTGAPVMVTGTGVTSNTAGLGGGGWYNSGQVTLLNSSIRHNVAGSPSLINAGGGGLNNAGLGQVSVLGSTFSDNTAIDYMGGGVFNDGTAATVTMVNSTVNGNQTTASVVSLFQPQGGGPSLSGAGLANLNGTVDLSNVTVTSNTISGSGNGGGLYNSGLATTTTTLRNTIVALNVATGSSADDCAGTFNSQGYNLVQNVTGCTLAGNTTGNLTGQDPLLLPLGNYGGPTLTRNLPTNSPAIDAGNPSGCRDGLNNLLSVDQRGYPRPDGPSCDIGAVEGLSPLNMRILLPLILR